MPQRKPKPTISKRDKKNGRPRGRTIKLDVGEYPGADTKLILHPETKPDMEVIGEVPKDAASKHKYPPPRKNKRFREVWMQFIDSISTRENFNIGHLNSLEVLCDAFVEYDELQAFIRVHGRTYKSVGRTGVQWKFYPEADQLNRVQKTIQEYMKILGLGLAADRSKGGNGTGGEGDEWS